MHTAGKIILMLPVFVTGNMYNLAGFTFILIDFITNAMQSMFCWSVGNTSDRYMGKSQHPLPVNTHLEVKGLGSYWWAEQMAPTQWAKSEFSSLGYKIKPRAISTWRALHKTRAVSKRAL